MLFPSIRFATRLLILGHLIKNIPFFLSKNRLQNDCPKRILVAHNLLLGDTLLLTPLLAKLRTLYPEGLIRHAMPSRFLPLYEKRPYGVEAVAYDPKNPKTVQALASNSGYDLAIIPGDNRHSLLAKALKTRLVVAFAGEPDSWKNWCVDQFVPFPEIPTHLGEMFASLVPGQEPPPYHPSQWPTPIYTPFSLPKEPYAVLHVGASSPLKHWDSKKWADLAKSLTNKDLLPVWSGGSGEELLVREADPEGLYPSFAGKLDLPQLFALLQASQLLISPDTSVAHLGRIIGVPTVTLFGPGSSQIHGATSSFWRNIPSKDITLSNFPCRDQSLLFRRSLPWARRCGRSLKECSNPLCMKGIELNSVLSEI